MKVYLHLAQECSLASGFAGAMPSAASHRQAPRNVLWSLWVDLFQALYERRHELFGNEQPKDERERTEPGGLRCGGGGPSHGPFLMRDFCRTGLPGLIVRLKEGHDDRSLPCHALDRDSFIPADRLTRLSRRARKR
jgi:hypothetical protein